VNKQELTHALIVERAAEWPKEDQLKLIRALLFQLGPDDSESRNPFPHRPTFEQAAGVLKTEKLAPSDKEIEKLLRERRKEKYGS
jgi:hypothetical protein